MNAPKVITRNLLVLVTFLFVARLGYAQAIGPTVETPTSRHPAAVVDSNDNISMAGEFKSTKNVQMTEEKPRCLDWYADFGYWSEYNFRGTNLTPGADGAIFFNADVTKWGFTLGVFGIRQLGTAHSPSFSMGEGGGGGTSSPGAFSGVGAFFPTTVQDAFAEIDLTIQYRREFGPIELTVGNIGFFIDRDAETFIDLPAFTNPGPPGVYGPFPTVLNEQFDRLFVRLATHAIPYLEPWITYYQTVYSSGQDPFEHSAPFVGNDPTHQRIFYPGFLRSAEENGGYLEGRLRGKFSIGDRVDLNPFGVISYSFGDRSEPVANPPTFEEQIRGRPLRGFNVAQAGLEVRIHLLHILGYSGGTCAPPDVNLSFVPICTYSYHISEPTAGTDRDEVFGGAKFALTF
jgi:hypothetical protein